MKNFLIAIGFILSVPAPTSQTPTLTPAQQQNPAYAKWGMLAVKETQQKYPNARLIDYEHLGSETKGNTTIEKFKLWLKDDRHEFGVIITITFKTETGDLLKIDFQETDR